MRGAGLSESTLHRRARALGLKKTKAHMKQMQQEAADAARRSHILNGTYPPKGYIIPNSEKYRYKPGHKESMRVKRKRIASMSQARLELVRSERERIANGLPQLTRIKLKPVL